MNIATVMRLLSALLFAGSLVYLYVEFENVRTGAISLVDYLWPVGAIIVLAIAMMVLARRIGRGETRDDKTVGTF